MFTGIITSVGVVETIDKKGDWVLAVAAPDMAARLDVGASVACSGICLTVIEKNDSSFKVQLSRETLEKTTAKDWAEGRKINLERALRMGDELGGHILTGHVDGLAQVVARREEGDSLRFRFRVPQEYSAFVASKGSIALDGISLTVNEVEGRDFGVNIIPFTQANTTMGTLREGEALNFEIDLIARYVMRRLEAKQE